MAFATRKGLGDYLVCDPNTGLTVDCDDWSNLFNLACWGGNSITGAGTGPYAGCTAGASAGAAGNPPTVSSTIYTYLPWIGAAVVGILLLGALRK
jgi:hypothetical protein